MSVSSDFRDLLRALSAARARFLIVGGYAVIHHTEPRFTKDLDVWIEPTAANAKRVIRALQAFGAPTNNLTARDFEEANIIYQIGVAPVRVDILTSVPGLEFGPAFRRSVMTTYDDVPVRILSLQDILAAKRTAGRPQDVLDAERLERALANDPKAEAPVPKKTRSPRRPRST